LAAKYSRDKSDVCDIRSLYAWVLEWRESGEIQDASESSDDTADDSDDETKVYTEQNTSSTSIMVEGENLSKFTNELLDVFKVFKYLDIVSIHNKRKKYQYMARMLVRRQESITLEKKIKSILY
jgi:hypothetical protein